MGLRLYSHIRLVLMVSAVGYSAHVCLRTIGFNIQSFGRKSIETESE